MPGQADAKSKSLQKLTCHLVRHCIKPTGSSFAVGTLLSRGSGFSRGKTQRERLFKDYSVTAPVFVAFPIVVLFVALLTVFVASLHHLRI